jgi:hypothetical protein
MNAHQTETRREWFVVAALLLGTLANGAGSQTPIRATTAPPPPYIQGRLVFAEAAPGRQPVRHGDSTIFLAPDAVLSDDDLVSVSTSMPRGRGLVLHLRCRRDSCDRLADATSRNVGRSLAVLIDSRVWSVAPIASSIGGAGSVHIAIDATGADAARIVQRIQSQWPAPVVEQLSGDTTEAKIQRAEVAALRWLALVDSSRYAMSWDSTATSFRSQVTRREWEAAALSARSQVDPLRDRRRRNADYTRELPDAPPGEYVVFQFSAAARDNTGVIETIALTRETDGSWRVIGYFIRPN